MRNFFDARLLWAIRHLVYKLFAGKLGGIGYLGRPNFAKGLSRLHADSGLGIFPGWRIEIIGGCVKIGKNVRIGDNILINCGSQITIGDNVTFSANCFIGTTDYLIPKELDHSFRDWPTSEKPVVIGDGCFIGFGAVILPGTTLGKGSIVGANTVVKGDFEPGSIIASERGKCIKMRN